MQRRESCSLPLEHRGSTSLPLSCATPPTYGLDSPQLPSGDEGRHFRKGFAFRPPPCTLERDESRESLARAAKEGLRTGAAKGLTAVEVEGQGRGRARALSVAS
ncbi:hypothetical protein E2C01_058271 [Portunus trituberculatus]|uniref:Uncharacterized protein n=1 Tax=Portunus trituberculatus TaxID=210409 RepID=A0A5B7H2J0_PORTR|nr:hypothetical protein [Portunus trituberculatus]